MNRTIIPYEIGRVSHSPLFLKEGIKFYIHKVFDKMSWPNLKCFCEFLSRKSLIISFETLGIQLNLKIARK